MKLVIITPILIILSLAKSTTCYEYCNFEQGLCGFVQATDDVFDWTLNSGPTSSRYTGPSNDHTLGNIIGHYVYIESSSPRRPGDNAVLLGFANTVTADVTNATADVTTVNPGCLRLRFWYHMYGPSMGTLKVGVQAADGTRTTLWSLSGSQSDAWSHASLDIPGLNTGDRVLFEGIRGNDIQGDIALDDITLESAECSDMTTVWNVNAASVDALTTDSNKQTTPMNSPDTTTAATYVATTYMEALTTDQAEQSGPLDWAPGSLAAGAQLQACSGASVPLPWELSVRPGVTLLSLEWLFQRPSEELVVAVSSGEAWRAMPSYAGRVDRRGRAGLTLKNVTTGDAGNFTLVVEAMDDTGHHLTLKTSASLDVGGLTTADGRLEARMKPQPVLDATDGQFHVQLACGRFAPTNPPPFNPTWTTPSGKLLPSTEFQDGEFLLTVANPAEGGNYTCKVPEAAGRAACVAGDLEAPVTLDAVLARLAVLEAENQMLKDLLHHSCNCSRSALDALAKSRAAHE